MSQGFLSQLPTFTLESLVASGQWDAAQNANKKKSAAKLEETEIKKNKGSSDRRKITKPAL